MAHLAFSGNHCLAMHYMYMHSRAFPPKTFPARRLIKPVTLGYREKVSCSCNFSSMVSHILGPSLSCINKITSRLGTYLLQHADEVAAGR